MDGRLNRDYIPLTDIKIRPVRDPLPRDVSDIDPIPLLSAWLRWAEDNQADAPAALRMDTIALLSALAAARRELLRGPQDL